MLDQTYLIVMLDQTYLGSNFGNKLIRFVMGTHSRSHVLTAEFKEMNWLPVKHRVA